MKKLKVVRVAGSGGFAVAGGERYDREWRFACEYGRNVGVRRRRERG